MYRGLLAVKALPAVMEAQIINYLRLRDNYPETGGPYLRARLQIGTLRSCSLAAYYWLMTGVESVMATLRANMGDFEPLGVRRLGVFGSIVTGEAGPDSDLDILVEFHLGRKSFDGYMDLKFRLEELFPDKRIDLVPENVLKPAIRPHVERTIRYVA